MVNAQEWLNQNYPREGACQEENSLTGNNNFGKRRAEVTRLKVSYQYLEGSLVLSDFVNLEILNCSYNNLTSLDLSNCNKLAELTCDNDQYSIPLVIIPTIKKDIIDKKNKIEQQKANLEFDDTKKELLEKLIIAQLDSSKAQKLRLPFYKIEKGKYKIYDELVDKLGENEEFMERIQLILADCEELVAQELELKKYNQKQVEIVNITFPKKKNIKITSVGLSEKEYGWTCHNTNEQQAQIVDQKL